MNIAGFADLCEMHKDKPIYIYNQEIVAGFDLLVDIKYRYNFIDNCKKEIEDALRENLYMFDIERSSLFYWPNDNMHSHSNEMRGLKGYLLYLKPKYGGNLCVRY